MNLNSLALNYDSLNDRHSCSADPLFEFSSVVSKMI